jgi:betaine reductase
VSLGLPVYHILEPQIKEQIDPSAYKTHLELMDIALDVEQISRGLDKVRNKRA